MKKKYGDLDSEDSWKFIFDACWWMHFTESWDILKWRITTPNHPTACTVIYLIKSAPRPQEAYGF